MLLEPKEGEYGDKVILRSRIDDYFTMAKTKKIGRPVAAEFDVAFFEMVAAFNLNRLNPKDTYPLQYCYENYHKDVSPENGGEMLAFLEGMYLVESKLDEKRKILQWLCAGFNNGQPGEELSETMFNFAKLFKNEKYLRDKKVLGEHLDILINSCRDQYAKTLGYYKYLSEKEERSLFCVEHDIKCQKLVPAISDLEKKLFAEQYNEQSRAIKLLQKMGAKAMPAEASILKMLYGIKHQSFPSPYEVDLYLDGISILGNIKTDNPNAIELLIDSLDSKWYNVPKYAVDALAKIGGPALPYLIELIQKTEGGVLVKAIESLKKMGTKAKSAVPILKKIKENTKDCWLKDTIQDAISQCE